MIYRNFNMIPKDNIDTSELVNIIPFKDGNDWYLELIYEYENHKGKHTVIFPKAALPFSQKGFPTIRCNISDDDIYQLHAYTDKFTFYPHSDLLERPYISCDCSMPLYKSGCTLATERGVKDPCYCFDIITESAPREMTIDEIEKELGYKVKIINKENKK